MRLVRTICFVALFLFVPPLFAGNVGIPNGSALDALVDVLEEDAIEHVIDSDGVYIYVGLFDGANQINYQSVYTMSGNHVREVPLTAMSQTFWHTGIDLVNGNQCIAYVVCNDPGVPDELVR